MTKKLFAISSVLLSGCAAVLMYAIPAASVVADTNCPQDLDHTFTRLHSSETYSLCDAVSARAILIVNTASHCGFTPQFQGLETLHRKYADSGLVIVGFPSNDFNQEAASEAETAKICYINNGVTFTMTSPVSVKGSSAHPLFQHLAEQTRPPSWNFNKYLVNPATGQITHYESQVAPDNASLVVAIEQLL